MITFHGIDIITYMLYNKADFHEAGVKMANKRATNFEEFEAGLLKRPGVRREYEALKPRYDMIKSLIKRRSQLKISQTELAKIIGTKQPAISRLEKGDYNTTLKTFFKVAEALDLEISYKARKKD